MIFDFPMLIFGTSVCLERKESMRKSWMQVLDDGSAGSALYV